MLRRLLSHPVVRSSGLRIVALVLGVLGGVVIARFGGAEIKGVASAFASANTILLAFLSFDIPHQALRRGRLAGDLTSVAPTLARAWAIYVVGCAAVVVVLMAFALPGPLLALGAVACLVGAQAATAATGLHGPVIATWGAVIQQAAIVVGALVLGLGGVLTKETVQYLIVAAYLAPMFLYLRYLLKDSAPFRQHGFRELGLLMRTGIPWQIARLPQTLLLKMDVVIVFAVLGAETSGIYSVGLSLAMLCTIVPAQLASSVLYKATRGQSRNSTHETVQAALLGLGSATVLAVVGAPAIAILYGAEFASAYTVLLACLVGACSYGVMQVQSNYIRILGTARHLAITNSVGLGFMLLGFVFLIPGLGAVGAGLSFSVGCTATALFTHILRRRFLPEIPRA